MILAGLLTVALLLLVLVITWRCWNLPPIPAIRWWAVGFGLMTAAMLAQTWRAEVWRNRYHKLEPLRQRVPPQSQPRQRLSTTTKFCTNTVYFSMSLIRFLFCITTFNFPIY